MKLEYLKGDNDPCAVGYFVHVYVDRYQQKKVVNIPKNIYSACKLIEEKN